mmetsp:Transcript_49718/g.98702  ORF Transcript_49718/g.98702 Transcript_49718/m.98702 type:complete len:213 (-) Transcript_49718:564-1202(-)
MGNDPCELRSYQWRRREFHKIDLFLAISEYLQWVFEMNRESNLARAELVPKVSLIEDVDTSRAQADEENSTQFLSEGGGLEFFEICLCSQGKNGHEHVIDRAIVKLCGHFFYLSQRDCFALGHRLDQTWVPVVLQFQAIGRISRELVSEDAVQTAAHFSGNIRETAWGLCQAFPRSCCLCLCQACVCVIVIKDRHEGGNQRHAVTNDMVDNE